MKRKIQAILPAIVLCLFAGGASAQDAVVRITGGASSLRLYNDKTGNATKIFAPKADDGGLTITIPQADLRPMMYILTGERSAWFSPVAGETVTIDMSGDEWKYGGPRSELNTFLDRWTQTFYMGRPNELAFSYHMHKRPAGERFRTHADPRTYFEAGYREWMLEQRTKTTDGFARLTVGEPALMDGIGKTLDYMWIDMWLMNYMINKAVVGAPPADAVLTISFDDPFLLEYPGVDNLMRYYFTMQDDAGTINPNWAEDLATKASMIEDPAVREHYVLSELDILINRGKYLYGTDRVLASVADMVYSERGRARYEAMSKAYANMSEGTGDGSHIYPFDFEGPDGERVKIGDFAGKYLYIDIWATWCGPCKAEIPYLKKLEEQMEGKNIEFLSISVDKKGDRDKWLAMIEDMGLGGHHAISPNTTNHEFFLFYGVTGIPRFMLVGPDGTLLMSRARRPSEPILLKQLEELVGE